MVLGVGDQHVALGVDAEVLGAVERRLAGVAAVAGVAFRAGAGQVRILPARSTTRRAWPPRSRM